MGNLSALGSPPSGGMSRYMPLTDMLYVIKCMIFKTGLLIEVFQVIWVGVVIHATQLPDYLPSQEDGTLTHNVPDVVYGWGHSPCLYFIVQSV